MTKPKLDIKELEKDYLQLNNLHKLAKKYHTSHIRISKLFKENGINIQNIGKRRDVTDGEIKKWIEEYDNGLSMEQLSKKYGVRVKKIRSILFGRIFYVIDLFKICVLLFTYCKAYKYVSLFA